jgi:hypothetical protein
MSELSFAQVQKLLRAVNMTIRITPCGEYRIAHTPYVEAEAYYAADLDDAIGTARAMCLERYDVVPF